jgi:TrbL/VirB6 plasmid conjugal transfer protein
MSRWRRRARRLTVAAAAVLAVVLVTLTRPAAGEITQEPAPGAPQQTVPPEDSACAPGDSDGDDRSSVVPDDCWGRFPSSHYDIGCDEGAWNHVSRKVYCTFTDLTYQGARASTAVALWLIGWSYGFDVYDRLGGHAIAIADTYDRHLIGPLNLGHFAWFLAIAWAAATALRGRITAAAAELGVSFVVAVLAGVFMANPAGYLHGMFDTMGSISGALFATASGQPPPDSDIDADAVLAPLQTEIHAAFVEAPYDYLNWGGPLTGPCAAARDRILADGPHGADDAPRQAMTAADCREQAEFNHDPNGSRLFGAVLTLVAAVIMVVLIVLVALTVVVAQMVAIVLFSLAPFALLAGILPAGGRTLAWAWLGALGRVLLAVVGMSFVLSLLLLTVQALLAATTDVGLVERFALLNVVIATMFIARKRILAGGHNLASHLAQRLATRRPGAAPAAAWMAAPAVAGVTGFALGASVGADRPTRSGRLAGAGARNQLANRRLHKHAKAAERRAARTTTRQRTEITVDADGNPESRTAVTVDGPAPKSRRARAARERLEREATTRHARAEARRRPRRPTDRHQSHAASTTASSATARTAPAPNGVTTVADPAGVSRSPRRSSAEKPDAPGATRKQQSERRPPTDDEVVISRLLERRPGTGWVGGPPSSDPTDTQDPVDPEE